MHKNSGMADVANLMPSCDKPAMDEQAGYQLLEPFLERREALRRFLVARTGDAALAEDILQDMYLRLSAVGDRQAVENAGAYLYRMAGNMMLDQRKMAARRQRRDRDWSDLQHGETTDDTPDSAPDPEATTSARQQLGNLMEKIEELPTQCRAVFKACRLEGITQREAAARFGVSVGTIEKHMARALHHLAQAFQRDVDDP